MNTVTIQTACYIKNYHIWTWHVKCLLVLHSLTADNRQKEMGWEQHNFQKAEKSNGVFLISMQQVLHYLCTKALIIPACRRRIWNKTFRVFLYQTWSTMTLHDWWWANSSLINTLSWQSNTELINNNHIIRTWLLILQCIGFKLFKHSIDWLTDHGTTLIWNLYIITQIHRRFV